MLSRPRARFPSGSYVACDEAPCKCESEGSVILARFTRQRSIGRTKANLQPSSVVAYARRNGAAYSSLICAACAATAPLRFCIRILGAVMYRPFGCANIVQSASERVSIPALQQAPSASVGSAET